MGFPLFFDYCTVICMQWKSVTKRSKGRNGSVSRACVRFIVLLQLNKETKRLFAKKVISRMEVHSCN